MSFDTEEAKQLRCPVCLDIFTDPCFVCPGHHSLCRSCYTSVKERDSRCPQCRQPMTQAVENYHVRSLVSKFVLQQAACVEVTDRVPCQRSAIQQCGHCEKQLCQLHICQHRVQFQTDCLQVLSLADQTAKMAEQTQWLVDGIIRECVRQLESLGRDIHAKLDSTPLVKQLRADAAELRVAIDAEDLREAVAVSGRLTQAISQWSLVNPQTPGLTQESPYGVTELVTSFDKLFTDSTASAALGVFDHLVEQLSVSEEEAQTMRDIVKYLACLHQRRDLSVVVTAVGLLSSLDLTRLKLCLSSLAIGMGDKALDN